MRVNRACDDSAIREDARFRIGESPMVQDGREAVDLALRLEPDVVTMDVSMPCRRRRGHPAKEGPLAEDTGSHDHEHQERIGRKRPARMPGIAVQFTRALTV